MRDGCGCRKLPVEARVLAQLRQVDGLVYVTDKVAVASGPDLEPFRVFGSPLPQTGFTPRHQTVCHGGRQHDWVRRNAVYKRPDTVFSTLSLGKTPRRSVQVGSVDQRQIRQQNHDRIAPRAQL